MSTIRATAQMPPFTAGSNAAGPSKPPSLKRRAAALALPVLLTSSVLLGACGSDDDTTSTKTDKTATTVKAAEETTTTVAEDGSITVTAVDFNYEGLPDTVPAGTKFKLVNNAEEELHEFVAFRLPDDEKRSADELIKLPQAELEAMFGGPPATVLLAKPGGPQIDAVGDGTISEPGRYLVACSIPVGADADELLESEGPPPAGGTPHFHKGMYAELVVE
ncbi:hypothetical protein ACE2AJ_10225 [Aquihabitans daechungensis]|uniref:hypothetical protein n=1 Tax=Aquihabitans daechungensis TaxID=1052257 RepID=UPI003BA13093